MATSATFRHLFIPDPGHAWFKLDLTGADLWTVAARCATLGDRTMLDDLLAGIRVPSLIGLILEHSYHPGPDRAVIKQDCIAYRKALVAAGRKAFDTTVKRCSHLYNYGGQPKKAREVIIEDTYKEHGAPWDPGLDLCKRIYHVYTSRYWGLLRWWADTERVVLKTGKLEMATGRVREFLSRRIKAGKLDDATRREALAAEPQDVTTYVCNQATHVIWHDQENWPSGSVGVGNPLIQMLLWVHDEIAGMYPVDQRPFLVSKLRAAFDRTIRIGRIDVKIPYDGATGTSWGACKDPI